MPVHPPSRPLPSALPIFPLAGVLLLPRGRLPLHVFEPRYVAMVEDSLAGERMIGMIQPTDPASHDQAPTVYATGCAGRITGFRDMENGRYMVTLTGVCRFRIVEELELVNGYRRVTPAWDDYLEDMVDEPGGACSLSQGFDRARLLCSLPGFLDVHDIAADWDTIEGAPDERLVTSLAMVCPFDPSEKQALLEAPTLAERGTLLTSLIEMALVDRRGGGRGACH
jgi:hypothetical protein